MAKNITIRSVTAGDVETVQSLFEQEAKHNDCAFSEDSPCHPVNAAVAVVTASLNKDDMDCGWLAFCEGEAAGIITTPQNLAGGVFVAAAFRGQGVGQALVQERERYFKEDLGLTEVARPVRADNQASIKLHTEKLGYSFTQASQNLLDKTPNLPGHTVLYLAKTL